MGIGKRIKEARETKGYTQKELSKIVGVTASAITNYENETSHPKEPVLYALLDALECDANFLFQDAVKLTMDSYSLQEKQIIYNYRSLNQEGQEKLVDYADDLVRSNKYKKCNSSELVEENA